ncbi:MAG: hypothetical protein LIO79_00305 [Rikenellaceae bacterium]|nr:hypothetical protein [Rikenellaceae bacterium]
MRNKILLGFWAGAILGIVSAISLFSDKPVSKREVRKMVKEEAGKSK